MAVTRQITPDHYVVHMGSPSKSKVTVEVHMSREEAARLMQKETARRQRLNPNHPVDEVGPTDLADAVLMILMMAAT